MVPGRRRADVLAMPVRHSPLLRVGALGIGIVLVAAATFGCDRRPVSGAGPDSTTTSTADAGERHHIQASPVAAPRAVSDAKATASIGPLAPPAQVYRLSTDVGDRFAVQPAGTKTTVRSGAANRGGNTRLVWVSPTGAIAADEQVCATWESWSGLAQPGLALRVRTDGVRLRAVTVTGNIYFGARFGFNVHAWDTLNSKPGVVPATYVGGADLSPTLGPANRLLPLPWRICARVKGRMLDFKVWSTAQAEPVWGDVRYGRRFQLPAVSTYVGRAGWYAGHLRTGDHLTISDQVTTILE